MSRWLWLGFFLLLPLANTTRKSLQIRFGKIHGNSDTMCESDAVSPSWPAVKEAAPSERTREHARAKARRLRIHLFWEISNNVWDFLFCLGIFY